MLNLRRSVSGFVRGRFYEIETKTQRNTTTESRARTAGPFPALRSPAREERSLGLPDHACRETARRGNPILVSQSQSRCNSEVRQASHNLSRSTRSTDSAGRYVQSVHE